MSEKRKIQKFNLDEGRIWEAIEGLSSFKTTYTLDEVCEKLNEQQATINELEKNFEDLVDWSSEIAKRNVLLDEEIGKLKEENKYLIKRLEKFPPKIREVWLED